MFKNSLVSENDSEINNINNEYQVLVSVRRIKEQVLLSKGAVAFTKKSTEAHKQIPAHSVVENEPECSGAICNKMF